MPATEKVTAATPSAFKEGLRRLWRGEQPLWKAFWLYLVVGTFVASILGLLLAAAVEYAVEYVGLGGALGNPGALLLYAPFSFLAPVLYHVFAAVGAWRSASWRHVTGILARICIFISLSATLVLILLLIGSAFYVALQG